MAFYATVGCIGNPDDVGEYRVFEMGNMTIHVEKSLLNDMPESGGIINVSFGDYGFFDVVVK